MLFVPLVEVYSLINTLKLKMGSFDLRTLVGAMVEGARCWSHETEKPRFTSTVVQIMYVLA